jgi:hypothetical protein
MKLGLGLLMAGLLAATLPGAVSGEDAVADGDTPASPGLDEGSLPVVLGGRIEVPSAGYALTFPERWYAFDVTHPDLLSGEASIDAYTAAVGPRLPAAAAEAVAVRGLDGILDVSLMANQMAREPDVCFGMTAAPGQSGSVDAVLGGLMRSTETLGAVFPAGPEVVSLPVGPATVIHGEPDGPSPGLTLPFVAYFIEAETAYVLYCESKQPPDDRWLSIAETFEVLPAEG